MAAELQPSSSQNPPTENLVLGHLITDATLPDPVAPTGWVAEIRHAESSLISPDGENDAPSHATAVAMAEVVEETAASDEEVELRNAMERDLFELAIERAKIESAREGLGTGDEEEEGKDGGPGENDNLDVNKSGKDSESVENENESEENVGGKSGDATAKLGRYSNRRRVNYPMRPDAEDCAFYMKFGSCKFGSCCKFNHPPRRKNQGVKGRANHREESLERAGQTECKYYLTPGGCKYGKDCKYSHGADKISTPHAVELNFLGLPLRPGEKECPYYMRTGSCKFGSHCKFHHPEPTAAVGGDSPSGYGKNGSLPSQLVSSSSFPSWSSPRAFNETSSFVPMFSPTQGSHTSNPPWNGYQAATYPTSESGLPIPPAFALNNLSTEIHLPMQHQDDKIVEEYPQRPGEPECSFFLKNGDCKFKSNCKFHHPKDLLSKSKPNSLALNDKGLPLRPDQPICTHYQRYGICKFGPACKYDHPSQFSILPTSFDRRPFGSSDTVQGAVGLEKGDDN